MKTKLALATALSLALVAPPAMAKTAAQKVPAVQKGPKESKTAPGFRKGSLVAAIKKLGALPKGALAPVRAAKNAFKACRAAVRSGKAKKGSCTKLRINIIQARLAAFAKAKPIKDSKLAKRFAQVKQNLQKRLEFLKKKAAKLPGKK